MFQEVAMEIVENVCMYIPMIPIKPDSYTLGYLILT